MSDCVHPYEEAMVAGDVHSYAIASCKHMQWGDWFGLDQVTIHGANFSISSVTGMPSLRLPCLAVADGD